MKKIMKKIRSLIAILCCISISVMCLHGTSFAEGTNNVLNETLGQTNSENGSCIIQMNGMKDNADEEGWALFGSVEDETANAGKVKMTTPDTATGTISKSGGQNKTEYTNLSENTDYIFTVVANEGYKASVMSNGQSQDLVAVDGNEETYTFTVHTPQNSGAIVLVDVSFSKNQSGGDPIPGPEDEVEHYIDIKMGDIVFSRVTNGSVIKGDFDPANLDFEIIKYYTGDQDTEGVSLTNCKTKGFVPDSEGRNPMEIRTTKQTDDSVTVNIENHIGNVDPAFYFTNITFAKNTSNYVGISSELHPFLFQDTVSTDKVSLGADSKSASEFTVYYGSNTITFNSIENELAIQKIELADDVAKGAVTIKGNIVTFNSSYYNSLVFKVTLENDTVGYVKINRIGIEIAGYDFGDDKAMRPDGSGPLNCAYHGSQNGLDLSDEKYNNKHNVIASFYFDGTNGDTGEMFDVVSIATFGDGHTETSIVEAVSTTEGGIVSENIKVADYIVWTGDKADAPIKVSVTAVNHGAISDSGKFGGAKFGSGIGVTKELK